MSKDELDELFRKSASKLHPEFDPSAWRDMEKKLDAHQKKTSFWRRIGWLAAFLLLGSSLIWVSLILFPEEKVDISLHTLPSSTPLPLPKAAKDNIRNDIKPKVKSKEDLAKIRAVIPDATHQSKAEQSLKLLSSKPKTRIAQVDIKSNSNKNSLQANRYNKNFRADQKREKANGLLGKIPIEGKLVKEAKRNHNKIDFPIAIIPVDSTRRPQELLIKPGKPSGLEALLQDSTKKSIGKRIFNANRFAFGFLVAPDLSIVGFTNPGGISTNTGIMISYYISNHWNLSTGIIRARKIYEAKPEDYNVNGNWEGVSAVCKVLDVPINIGFKVLQKERASITINTGLSSYFMLSEKYDYVYGPYQVGRKTYEVSNQNRHLFGIYNISGSYNRQLINSVALGIEPFVKVPLTGIGAGEVKLVSVGVFLSFTYRNPK